MKNQLIGHTVRPWRILWNSFCNKRFSSTLFFATLLVACQTPNTGFRHTPPLVTTPSPVVQQPAQPITWSPDALLAQAQKSTGLARIEWELRAARAFTQNHDYLTAESLLEPIEFTQLTAPIKGLYVITQAELLLANRRAAEAVELLTTNRRGLLSFIDSLDHNQQQEIVLLRAQAYESAGQYLAAIRERVFVGSSLNEAHWIQNNNEAIWKNLNRLPNTTIQSLQASVPDKQLRGWIELISAYRNAHGHIQQQMNAVINWRNQWPGHPGEAYLPSALVLLQKAIAERPKKIVLMLPNSGKFASAAEVIRDGFMAAYYTDTNSSDNSTSNPSSNTSTSETSSRGAQSLNSARPFNESTPPEIILIDTSRNVPMATLYNEALAAGAEIILGPLDKQRVSELAQLGTLPIPTITLNYLTDTNTAPPNFFQFGLAAEDEARQIAERAAITGFRSAAIVFPETDWGHRVRHAFESMWLSLGGTIAEAMPFIGDRDYGNTIKSLMQIDSSEARARELRNVVGQRIEFIPRRRKDIDFIIVFGNPPQARQLKPALNFYFAGDLPTFSTSNIFTGQVNPKVDKDLDGIAFTDIPFLFEQDLLGLDMLLDADKTSGTQTLPRLLALGADAYALTLRLRLLKEATGATHEGYTGRLSLDTNQRIVRESVWATFKNGVPILDREPTPQTENQHSSQ